ncbi:stoned A [Lycorma delicatula]|uniref:stoned A n=1 Tax=Lycorma delicatula TaxID=130591 RepID=UPI003F5189A4
MLKITKGLKKKKKGKKGKHKEEELFEEAELEKYRRDQEEKRKQQAEAGEGEGEEKNEAKGEEWEKFKALTSGVDSILKKTQGDLDRIKSTSYYQRKPTLSELAAEQEQEAEKRKDKSWVGFEEGSIDRGDRAEASEEGGKVELEHIPEEEQEGKKSEEDEDEYPSEEEEDIFDTSYVDAVASGEVKLAYIPDSPIEEEGFDPFDTSIVDKVIKEDPVEKRKKNLVSLGCAVDVLTGRVEKPSGTVDLKQKRSPRRIRQQDLLLGSFDEGGEQESNRIPCAETESEEPVKTLLDDDPLSGEDIQVDLSINLAPIVAATSACPSPVVEIREAKSDEPIGSIISEFDTISHVDDRSQNDTLPNGKLEYDDDIDDEFAVLAAESLTKEVPTVSPLTVAAQQQQHSENQFQDGKSISVLSPIKKKFVEAEEGNEFVNDENDPFDTSFAAEILPGKYELKLIEEEILKEDKPSIASKIPAVSLRLPKSYALRDPLAYDEHNLLDDDGGTQEPLSFKHRDLLGGSTTDLSKISHNPIEPAPVLDKGEEEISYCDPFDTSVVNDLVAPGKAELKFLEKELLAEGPTNNHIVNDDDFDPRAESPPRKKSIPRPEQLFIGDKRQSIPKVVAFKVESPEPIADLLSGSGNEACKASKPLTPYYPEPKLLETKSTSDSEQDPFDTSFVSSTPGKFELKLIESEFVGNGSESSSKTTVGNSDFNPRAPEPNQILIKQTTKIPEKSNELNQDILSEDVHIDTKLHTPVVPKRIEEELELNYADPFDTSIAQHILPGKAELKLLESELIESAEPGTIKRSYTDPDFDPRLAEDTSIEQPKEKTPADLAFTEQLAADEVAVKPLTPLSASLNNQEEDEIDPFDTSCVGALIPGKAELKLLESELIHN